MKGSASWPKALAEAPLPQSKFFFCLPLKDFVELMKTLMIAPHYIREIEKYKTLVAKCMKNDICTSPTKIKLSSTTVFLQEITFERCSKKGNDIGVVCCRCASSLHLFSSTCMEGFEI